MSDQNFRVVLPVLHHRHPVSLLGYLRVKQHLLGCGSLQFNTLESYLFDRKFPLEKSGLSQSSGFKSR